MTATPDFYAQRSVSQIPRLLSLQDRNPYSPTYGCFHRDYWLFKTSDFPDAVRQFGVHALALVYKYDFPGSKYKGQPKIRDWAIAGLDYWASIQHRDGSFDEFYPYERGWVGPSAFTTYTSIEAFNLLQEEIPSEVKTHVREAIHRAANFIIRGESEEDHLANHYAMACLATWKAYELLGDSDLREGFARLWQAFLTFHHADEGWSREYDGIDPGYLSATVSFLSKIYQSNKDPEILRVLQEAVECASYFVYPNGFYAGSLGSRNTLHFYPHGFEVLAGQMPMAAAIAENMLAALGEGKLVPPEIMSDRYVFYRVPELLLAYIDYQSRTTIRARLPYEREPFEHYFPGARIFAAKTERHYVLANLAKGGVVKVFDLDDGNLVLNDCGFIGRLKDGRIVTSQWVDPAYDCTANKHTFTVSGNFHVVPSNKLFTLFRNILFRGVLFSLGWIPAFAHFLKGRIRKALILGQKTVPIAFSRRLEIDGENVLLQDSLKFHSKTVKLDSLSVGDEFFVRYVPQSRYFQSQELGVEGFIFDADALNLLADNNGVEVVTSLASCDGTPYVKRVVVHPDKSRRNHDSHAHGKGSAIYGADYYYGRISNRQLVYRLQRRTDEVAAAIKRYGDGPLSLIVDIGTADGLMLSKLQEQFVRTRMIGLDMSFDLLGVVKLDGIHKAQADALKLPVLTDAADVVIATAIIEHVPNPEAMVNECARVLRPGGLMIMTTPVPILDNLAELTGIWRDTGHVETFNLRRLRSLLSEHGFSVLEARKFMFSPVGFPAEKTIERIFGPLGLRLIMANQIIVGQRTL